MGLLREISGDEKKPSKAVIEPPGKPHGVVAETVTEAATEAAAKSEPEKISCRHLRMKKILLIGNDSMGNLDWSDAVPGRQCVECGAVFSEGGD